MNVKLCLDDVNNSQTQCVTTHLVASPVLVLSVMERRRPARAAKTSMNVSWAHTTVICTRLAPTMSAVLLVAAIPVLQEMVSPVKTS